MEAREFVKYINNGVYTKKGKRPLDILDYYIMNNGTSPETFLDSIKNDPNYNKIRSFFNYNRVGEPLRQYDIDQIMSTKDYVRLKRDKNGMPIPGSGDIIEPIEKEGIIQFLVDNNIPLTKKTYLLAFRKYVDYELEINTEKNKTL